MGDCEGGQHQLEDVGGQVVVDEQRPGRPRVSRDSLSDEIKGIVREVNKQDNVAMLQCCNIKCSLATTPVCMLPIGEGVTCRRRRRGGSGRGSR